MKTTVEITDSLFAEAKECARARGVPVRQLIEDGLRRVIDEAKTRKPFKLRDCSVEGEGLVEGVTPKDFWKIIYEGRGY